MGTVYRRLKQGKRSRRWYIRYKDPSGRWRKEAAYTNRAASLQLIAQRERESARQQMGLTDPFAEHRRAPIADHLRAFALDLEVRGVTPAYRKMTMSRLNYATRRMGIAGVGDPTVDSAQQFLADLVTECGRSRATQRHYAATLKQFARWLARRGRLPADPLADLVRTAARQTMSATPTRALSAEELQRLCAAARVRAVENYRTTHPQASEEGLAYYRERGEERALLYLVAATTGLRRGELRNLTWSALDLWSEIPTVTVEARYAKSRRRGTVPLRSDVTEQLRTHREKTAVRLGRVPGADEPVFRMGWDTLVQFYKDLKHAGTERVDRLGRHARFHSLRHTTATLLGRAGVPPQVARVILRHSDIRTTLDTYTHLQVIDPKRAIEGLDLGEPGRQIGSTKQRHGETS